MCSRKTNVYLPYMCTYLTKKKSKFLSRSLIIGLIEIRIVTYRVSGKYGLISPKSVKIKIDIMAFTYVKNLFIYAFTFSPLQGQNQRTAPQNFKQNLISILGI